VDFRLEVVVVPVSDVDRAKAFYTERAGFVADHDRTFGDGVRVVQLTPRGSACSIVIGTGLGDAEPGSVRGLQLVVTDIAAARAELAGRGLEVSEIQVFESGSPRPSREGDVLDNVGFVFFRDPDGNSWAVQQIAARE